MQLACFSLIHFPMNSHARLGVSPTAANHSPQSTLSLSFTFTQPYPHGPQLRVLTGLVVLVDFFFNFLVVEVPHSLIFWHFWLYMDFRLVGILLLVVQGSKWFLPKYPCWLELLKSVNDLY